MYNSTGKKEEAKPKAPRVVKQEEKPREEAKPENKTAAKLKPPVKQDFFKPKPKEVKKEEKAKADTEDQPAAKMFFNVAKKEREQKEAVGPSVCSLVTPSYTAEILAEGHQAKIYRAFSQVRIRGRCTLDVHCAVEASLQIERTYENGAR